MEQKYDVFISYSRRDYVDENKNVIPNNVVSQIKEVLSKEGISFWFDEEGIYSGQDFTEKIVSNIEKSKVFLFLSTKSANTSKWTCKEIAVADELGKHIIPVRIDKTPYNNKVLFRIADLNFVEYYVNPDEGNKEMVQAIKTYLEEYEKQQKLKEAEQEKRQNKVQKEQEELIKKIELECQRIANDNLKNELERENLLLLAEQIQDVEKRRQCKEKIRSIIVSQEMYDDVVRKNQELTAQNEYYERQVSDFKGNAFVISKPKIWIYGVIMLLVFVGLVVGLCLSLNNDESKTSGNEDNSNVVAADTVVVRDTVTIRDTITIQKEQPANKTVTPQPVVTTTYSDPDETSYIDLGLPSKTLWKDKNEDAHYTYEEAMAKFGNRLPSKSQLEELKNKCRWKWTENGYQVTGPNGASITLPALGDGDCEGNFHGKGEYGDYWSSTPYKSQGAWYIGFTNRVVDMYNGGCHKLSVRLVR
ncbi:MAG: TIR domain-containing protein [Paludibacteraceae bacterium]|nr:TIR domain-containing protein [Paludibacteraceae bacterium]